MEFLIVMNSVLVMGIIIVLGTLIARNVKVTNELKTGLMFIIVNISLPSIVLNGVFSIEITEDLLNKVLLIFVLSIGYHLLALVFALIFTRTLRLESLFAKKITILTALGNTGFIGIPLCATIFGPIGGLLAAIFDAGLDFVIFSVVIYLLNADKKYSVNHWKALINPPFIAIVIGLFVATFGLEAPQLLKQLTSTLSVIAGPLAMLYMGMLVPPLVKEKGFALFPKLWLPLVGRLLIIPLIVMLVVTNSPVDSMIKDLLIILASMPTFMLATVLFSKYLRDDETAIVTTVYSTILSIVTIPLISLLATVWKGLTQSVW